MPCLKIFLTLQTFHFFKTLTKLHTIIWITITLEIFWIVCSCYYVIMHCPWCFYFCSFVIFSISVSLLYTIGFKQIIILCLNRFNEILPLTYFVNRPTDITPQDRNWVGAWWIPFSVFGPLVFFLGIPLLGFPKKLPFLAKKEYERGFFKYIFWLLKS